MRDADRGARNVLVWMCVLIAVNQLGFGAVIPVLPLYAQSFGVSQTAIGATVAVYGLARVLCSVPTGRVADLLGRRAALAIGGAVSVIGNLWCAAAASYPELVLARFVAGAGAGIVMTAGMIVLADITRRATRGRTMAIYQGVFLFAVGIGPLPGGYLASGSASRRLSSSTAWRARWSRPSPGSVSRRPARWPFAMGGGPRQWPRYASSCAHWPPTPASCWYA